MSEGQTKALTTRERLFCAQYLQLGDAHAAALGAGYSRTQAKKRGEALLKREEIGVELERLRESAQSLRSRASAGLAHLAFGGKGEMLQLVTGESGMELRLGEVDLFRVSELRVRRGGEVEIKFYDRQRALEKLWELEEGEGSVDNLYEALERSARELRDVAEDGSREDETACDWVPGGLGVFGEEEAASNCVPGALRESETLGEPRVPGESEGA